MSVQFGRWNFEGQAPAADYMEKIGAALAPYGPDSNESYSERGINILYRAFYTTKESRGERQPHLCSSGAVITWDGRLDNRAELISELRDSLSISSTDVAIVAAAYESWGTECFAKLIGDWALSIWSPSTRSLLLVKDPIGVRHLYYSFDDIQVTWSTVLHPLVRFAGKTLALNEEYIAGWFSCVPALHLTPYVAIHAVPPASAVVLHPRKASATKYWDFDPWKRIRYRTDAEYEEHFRTVFATAVQRRLRSDRPVLAELSGGMDSSSIVCMADIITARGAGGSPRLDTISWYDDSDPDLNEERFYFTKVEQKRNRTGHHIDVGTRKRIENNEASLKQLFSSLVESDRLAPVPDFECTWPGIYEPYMAYIRSQEYRITLSGFGGELPTGGFVPTPGPELQNLLARARFLTLSRQLNAWAVKMGEPRLTLLWEAVRGFLTLTLTREPEDRRLAPWFHTGFVRRNRAALFSYPSRLKIFGPLPSYQHHIHSLNHWLRVLANFGGQRLNLGMLREYRYPYLDRELLEFAFAVPQEQIVGVGKRRFLMKRALVGIVPHQVLNRKRRAAANQEPQKDTSEWPSLTEIGQHMIANSIGIIDPHAFSEGLEKARHNENAPVEALRRTLVFESWLRHLTIQGVLANSMATEEIRPRFSS